MARYSSMQWIKAKNLIQSYGNQWHSIQATIMQADGIMLLQIHYVTGEGGLKEAAWQIDLQGKVVSESRAV